MVKGLNIFKEHFRDYTDRFVLIGGTACYLSMDDAGVAFRATKDLDIVLFVEMLDVEFVKHFWEFIEAGNYENRQKNTGDKRFYRFFAPQDDSYPYMLELFSKKPDALTFDGEGHLTPIPMNEETSSLSAIMLDENYYEFIHSGKFFIGDLPVVKPEYLIPLKARAWVDLTERRANGEEVKGDDIKKHKNDVFRLFQIIPTDNIIEMPETVKENLGRFLDAMPQEQIDLKALGLGGISLAEVLSELRRIYGLTV